MRQHSACFAYRLVMKRYGILNSVRYRYFQAQKTSVSVLKSVSNRYRNRYRYEIGMNSVSVQNRYEIGIEIGIKSDQNRYDFYVFCQYLKNEASEANFDLKNPPQTALSQKNFIMKKKNLNNLFEIILFFCCVAMKLVYYIGFKIDLKSVLQSVSYRFHTDMNSVSISV